MQAWGWDLRQAAEILSGVAAWYAINGLVWYLLIPGPLTFNGPYGSGYEAAFFSLFMLPANLVVLLLCAIIRPLRRFALGLLIALAMNFVMSLLLGMTLNAYCFIPFIHK